MKKPRKYVPGWRDGNLSQNPPDGAAMVAAMQHDMRQHLFPRHAAERAIRECKVDTIGEILRAELRYIVNVPPVADFNGRLQLIQARGISCIGRYLNKAVIKVDALTLMLRLCSSVRPLYRHRAGLDTPRDRVVQHAGLYGRVSIGDGPVDRERRTKLQCRDGGQ
jgi:hypothetical protein